MSVSEVALTPDWLSAVDAVNQAESVLLIAHVTPDADALGSALALALGLESMGKSVAVSVGEPAFQVPDSLSFLPGIHLVVEPENVGSPDLVISCDTSSDERLGTLATVLSQAPHSIAIDHHASFTGFGQVHLVDPQAAATAEMALGFLDRLGVTLTKDIASCLYAGLVTDTGSFKFQGASGDTLRLGARLYDVGIDHSRLARLLFDDEPFDAIRMMGVALQSAVLVPGAVSGRGLVYTAISTQERGDLPEIAMERVIDVLRRTSEAEVAVIFKQGDDGVWKGSLRSKSLINVGKVATILGGGGHRFAAGYTGTDNLEQMISQLIAVLADAPELPHAH